MSMYEFNPWEIAIRVSMLRNRDFLTKKDFCEAIGITEFTLKKRETPENEWDKNQKAFPYKLQELINVCNVCNVDMDYLLGRQEEETRETKDLKELTGLSEKACKKLLEISYINEEVPVNKLDKELTLQCLSWFIENGLIDCISSIAHESFEWWKRYNYSPKQSDHELMMKYAKQAEKEDGGYIFFPTADQTADGKDAENEYWLAYHANKEFKAEMYDVKEKIAILINEYCEKNRNNERIQKLDKDFHEWFSRRCSNNAE